MMLSLIRSEGTASGRPFQTGRCKCYPGWRRYVNVFINGINVVTGTNSTQLQVVEKTNSTTGEKSHRFIAPIQTQSPLTISPSSGELASQLKNYNVTLDNLDSSGGYSIAKNLDSLANSLVNKVNSISITGYGLNDNGTLPPGRSFFEPVAGNATAANIQVSASIINNPENIPVSDATNERAIL